MWISTTWTYSLFKWNKEQTFNSNSSLHRFPKSIWSSRLWSFNKETIDALDLIKNYFKNRKQNVYINGTLSDLLSILLGVPQVSVLGPLFFIIFMQCCLKTFCRWYYANWYTLEYGYFNMQIQKKTWISHTCCCIK